VRSNPNAVQTVSWHEVLEIVLFVEVIHDPLLGICTGSDLVSGISSGKDISQEGIRDATSPIPARSSFRPRERAALRFDAAVLCSPGVEFREVCRTRRFRFVHWNFHVF
jgi:hypothetical protein